MSQLTKSILFWVISFLLMGSLAVYQRLTGPTHPERGKIVLSGETIKFKLLRSHESDGDAPIVIKTNTPLTTGTIAYKRLRVDEEWTTQSMANQNGTLSAYLPAQPPAGKLEYKVELQLNGETAQLTPEPIVIRYKGRVPQGVLIPHIFFMFFAMWFSLRTGIEALAKGPSLLKLTMITTLLLVVGGAILGPVVQKYAFGAFWTGWPFGHDLTDNKTLVALLGWVIAWNRLRRNPGNRGWVIAAALILIAVYLIPHSVLGSDLDYESGQVTTGIR
ncbi:MAG: hypothetical protein PHQ65_05330 [Bacteroidales bacterium]|nr:hypothetical protein [Bacteroidales bacterium]MDD3664665.1 hypothetical protein [Bacteroidales bacterium]